MIMCTFVYYSIILTDEAKEGSATLGCGKMIIPNDEVIRPEAGDYAIRKGVTQKPITSFDVCSTYIASYSLMDKYLKFF